MVGSSSRYAVYDIFGEFVGGPFSSAEKALQWLQRRPLFDLYDDEGCVAEGFGYEAAALQHAQLNGITDPEVRKRDLSEFNVLLYLGGGSKMGTVTSLVREPPAPSNAATHLNAPNRAIRAARLGDVEASVSSRTEYLVDARSWRGPVKFRFRVLGLYPAPDELVTNEIRAEISGDLWLLQLEVVNLSNEPMSPSDVRNTLSLVDDEGFRFDFVSTALDRDRASGIHRFSGWSDAPDIPPKMKATGCIPFPLPEQLTSYSIRVREGTLSVAD